jgi:serine/threonine protein kinase
MMNLACGSIQYAAPEILKRERYMGEMVDIWSVGIMLFGLVNSYLPFEDDGQGLSSVLRKIQLNDYAFKPGLSPEIRDLLTKMLSVILLILCNQKVDYKKRISISEIKSHPWFYDNEFLLYLDHLRANESLKNTSSRIKEVGFGSN